MNGVQRKPKKAGEICQKLLAHYARTARELPWRIPPSRSAAERPDPYHVWLSEIMLQQTTVAAVIPYFHKFTERWPDIQALAAADNDEVMAAWAGLGYYARARNLIKCAQMLTAEHDGQFPQEEGELLKLPGIGPYTAAAVAAIAFGKAAVVVDANIERVVARLFAISKPLPAGKADIRAATADIWPDKAGGDFAQALMDLGASICSVKNPDCASCPIAKHCAAYTGDPEKFPVPAPKKPKPKRNGMAYWIEKDGMVWLVKRPDKGMLGGMRALPDDGWHSRGDGDGRAPLDADWRDTGVSVDHVFTHFSLTLSIAATESAAATEMAENGEWWPIKSLDKAGLPTLFVKAAKAFLNLEKS